MKRFMLMPIIGAVLFSTCANVQADENNDQRLVIVNGNSGHVIYDDGRDDLYCVTRRHVIGYDDWGYPIKRRTMQCR